LPELPSELLASASQRMTASAPSRLVQTYLNSTVLFRNQSKQLSQSLSRANLGMNCTVNYSCTDSERVKLSLPAT
jgi:hypothetical protein